MAWEPVYDKLKHGTRKKYQPQFRLPQSYQNTSLGKERALQGFYQMFGVIKERLPREFRERLVQVIERGDLRCSTIRAVVEGLIPGIPPCMPDTVMDKKRIQQVLSLCDVMETLLYEHVNGMAEEPVPVVEEVLSSISETDEDIFTPKEGL